MNRKDQKMRLWHRMLKRHINELIDLAKELAPEAEIKVLDPFEVEDAVIEVWVQPENFDEVDEVLLHRSTQIWLDDGFDILAWVHEKKPVPAI